MLEILPFSADQYEQLIAAGILKEHDPVELVQGYLVGLDQGAGPARPQPDSPHDGPRLGGRLLWPLSIDQYQHMIAAGIVSDGDLSLELLEGFLVAKDRGLGPGKAQGIPHRRAVRRVTQRLNAALPGGVYIQVQSPVDLGPMTIGGRGSEPEPDVAVAQGPEARYDDHHPRPDELRLLVEAADSSLSVDRNYKAWLYASASIKLYWIVNLVDRQLEVYSDPDATTGQYRSRETLAEDQQVVLSWQGLPPITFAVKDFLP
jgi:Uma2 family endonuclease